MNDSAIAPRFDQQFIEDNGLVERYLEGKLPFKGARELEAWCRAHPDYLERLRLSERTHASLKLLDASGRAQDLREPKVPWWKTLYFQIGLGALALVSLVAFWVLFGKYVLRGSENEQLRHAVAQGSLLAPASVRTVRLQPDRAPGIGRARVSLSSKGKPELIQVKLDMSYTKLTAFRLQVEKQDQGRALVIENLFKDSNSDLHVAFNSSGLAAGTYNVAIEGLPFRGRPIAEGWLIVEVH
jgi:hypothetical protein